MFDTVKPPERLLQQLQFILEADRLKTILRQTVLADRSRNENSAEHSWHLALMVHVLTEYFSPKTDFKKTTNMLLIHDIVEIEAGDTFAYDDTPAHLKAEKEQQAALQIFGRLPVDQRDEFLKLWQEFEERTTLESKVAVAIDRLQPFLLNYFTDGASWRKHSVKRGQVEKRMQAIHDASPALHEFVMKMIGDCVSRGLLKPD
jgi:putative hydrolases of HD superfamily